MESAGKYIVMRGGRYPDVGNVLLGGNTSGSIFWVGVVVHVRVYDEDGGGKPYRITKAYHWEEGSEKHRYYMGKTGGRIGVECGWDADSIHIYRLRAGDGGAVSTYKTNIWIL